MATRVNVHRRVDSGSVSTLEADLEKVRQLARLLDAQFEIGGVKVGWDSIIGLVPVVGDVVTAAIATYPILIARKHNLPKHVIVRMSANVALDWAVGAVPVVGDLFDVAFKGNLRNLAILERAVEKVRERERRGGGGV